MALVVRGWGLEAALAAALFALWRVGAALDGGGLGVLFLGLIGIVVWRSARVRTWLAVTLRQRATSRWFARVLVACEVISRHGQLPRIEGSERIPAGRRLRLRIPPGFSAEKIEEAAEPLAATIGAREVRVRRDPSNASLAHLSLMFHDPLSAPAATVAGTQRGRCGSRSRSGSTRTVTPSRSAFPSATCCSAANPGRASRWRSRSSSQPPRWTPPSR